MIKRLLFILSLCFMGLNSMEERMDIDTSLRDNVQHSLHAKVQQALEKGDINTIQDLIAFQDFTIEGNRLEFDKYMAELKRLNFSPDIAYELLVLDGKNYIIHSDGTRFLQNFICEFGRSHYNLPLIKRFIRNAQPYSLNQANANENKRTILHEIMYIMEVNDLRNDESSKDDNRIWAKIVKELLRYGARADLEDKQGKAFDQTPFFVNNREQLERCMLIYHLRYEYQYAMQKDTLDKIMQLTRFETFVDQDRLDCEEYCKKLDKLGLPRMVLDMICRQNGINYILPNNARYLHTLFDLWAEERCHRDYLDAIIGFINNSSGVELNKIDFNRGTILNYLLCMCEKKQAHPEFRHFEEDIKLIIELLLEKGASLRMISSSAHQQYNKWYPDHGLQVNPSNQTFFSINSSNEDTLLNNGKVINQFSSSKNKGFFRRYGARMTVLSIMGVALCYLSYRILSQNKTFQARIQFK